MRVALFATCLADQFFADACADTVRLLRHLGVDVAFPSDQTCCGQPAYNAGHAPETRRMVEHTLRVFESFEHVVLPSGSCAGMVKCFYPEIMAKGFDPADPEPIPSPRDRASALAAKTYELSQFVVQVLGIDHLGDGLKGRRVAYHHGCHALRELRVEAEPLALLRGCGAEVVDWEAERECCGFGGLFSAKLPEVSAGMADRKLDTLPDVDLVASADGGCLLQLSGRSKHRKSGPPFRHLASVLWEGVGS